MIHNVKQVSVLRSELIRRGFDVTDWAGISSLNGEGGGSVSVVVVVVNAVVASSVCTALSQFPGTVPRGRIITRLTPVAAACVCGGDRKRIVGRC